MNYAALIENRKSVRSFTDKRVPDYLLVDLETYYYQKVKRLVPGIKTDLLFFNDYSKEALEGAAGYNSFLVGAPQYLVLLSEAHDLAHLNAGYIMQDLLLKAADMGLDSCWITFTSSEDVKEAIGIRTDLEVVALAAFGFGIKTTKRLRLNIRSMSDIDISAKRRYAEPKRSLYDMAFLKEWGSTHGLDDHIGFFDNVLWEALHAASLSPSYLNRQAYGFLLEDNRVSLVRRPDAYTPRLDGQLSLGIALLHFSAVASQWAGALNWQFGPDAADVKLPEDHELIASCVL